MKINFEFTCIRWLLLLSDEGNRGSGTVIQSVVVVVGVGVGSNKPSPIVSLWVVPLRLSLEMNSERLSQENLRAMLKFGLIAGYFDYYSLSKGYPLNTGLTIAYLEYPLPRLSASRRYSKLAPFTFPLFLMSSALNRIE